MNRMIVLNPLILKLLDEDAYNSLVTELQSKGYAVRDSLPGIARVKEQYKEWVGRTEQYPVIDGRCPYVADMVHKEFQSLENLIAPIDPILITGARMRMAEAGEVNELCVVSPCEGFNRYGNDRFRVITWKELRKKIGFKKPQKTLDTTPVPIGFYADFGFRVASASGEGPCRKLLSDYLCGAQLLELLWCEGGCHKGDGLY